MESRGGLRNSCPFQERYYEMSEKFTVEQKLQIAIESFTVTNIAELCGRHGVSVAQFHSSTDGGNASLKRGRETCRNDRLAISTRRRLTISNVLLGIRPLQLML
jgi:transposase-like protein